MNDIEKEMRKAIVNPFFDVEQSTTACYEIHKREMEKLKKTPEIELLELENQVKQREESSIADYKKDGYISGFCDGFMWYSIWLEKRGK